MRFKTKALDVNLDAKKWIGSMEWNFSFQRELFRFFFFSKNQTRKFIDRETQYTFQFLYSIEIVTDDLSLIILFIN